MVSRVEGVHENVFSFGVSACEDSLAVAFCCVEDLQLVGSAGSSICVSMLASTREDIIVVVSPVLELWPAVVKTSIDDFTLT